jgi:hypothetical protein
MRLKHSAVAGDSDRLGDPDSHNHPDSGDSPHNRCLDNLADTEFLCELRQQMIKFAMLQLQNDSHAEDVVQEALVGALKNAQNFQRRAALKT